jgi:sugar phosphate isomerase/epimerase
MRLGIFAKTFPGTQPLAVLGAAREAGYGAVQFNLACAGLPSLPADMPPDAVLDGIAAAATATSVELAALSGTYNMAHPDPAQRAAGLAGLRVVIAVAARLGIPLVTLCTGTRHATDQWAHHPANAEPSAWADMAREIAAALSLAEAAGVSLGIEPEQANIVTSAADARRLIAEMASPRLKIVLDPANLFEQATPDQARRIVAAAIDLSAGHIAMAHAKDRQADGRFATVGAGIVDFPAFIAGLRAAGFDGPLVTHGLEPAEAPGVARYLEALL